MRPAARIPYDVRMTIWQHRQKGLKVTEVTDLINKSGLNYSYHSVQKFLRRFSRRQSLFDMKRKGRPNDWPDDVYRKILKFIDDKMHEDNETTGTMMSDLIKKELSIPDANERKVKLMRQKLGWAYFDPNFKKIIDEGNKPSRSDFCRRILEDGELIMTGFKDCCFVDDCTVQLELERLNYQCFTKNGHRLIRLPSKTRDIVRLHIWAGVSWNGATELCIFDGRVPFTDALFVRIIREVLKPFQSTKYSGRRFRLFYPSNSSHDALHIEEKFIEMGGIDSIVLPVQSTDLNPMTLIWDQLQEYLLKDSKLATSAQLIASIEQFWATKVTTALCRESINRLLTTFPKVVELNGGSTFE